MIHDCSVRRDFIMFLNWNCYINCMKSLFCWGLHKYNTLTSALSICVHMLSTATGPCLNFVQL